MEESYEYGCLMVSLNFPTWKSFIERFIDPNDLHPTRGFDYDPHCTILYGFHDEEVNLEELTTMLWPLNEVLIRSNKINYFSNPEYDIIKFQVESPKLHMMNKIVKIFPHTSSFPRYDPHITIAYLMPGTGKKYCHKFEPFIITPQNYCYSYSDNVKKYFS